MSASAARRRLTIAVLLLALAGAAVAAALARRTRVATGTGIRQAVDSIAAEAIRERVAPGLSIAIGRGGRVELASGYGLAKVQRRVAVRPASIFRIGSLTKQFTAAAIMQLVEQRRLGLDDRVAPLVIELPGLDPSITIRQLLNHTSGIADYTALDAFARLRGRALTHAELLAMIAATPRDFAPGEQWRYSNSGYYLLGLILERVTGSPYAEYMKAHLFEPLGLRSTAYCDEDAGDDASAPLRAAGYHSEPGGTVRAADVISMKTPFAAGALCSTADDLVRWTQALVDGRVVNAESFALMTAPTRLPNGSELPVGFGLAVGQRVGQRTIFFGGVIEGFSSLLAYYPDRALVVAVLANDDTASLERVGDRVAAVAISGN
jgi:CubicO group peptidase (beta-lactamase class C family)